MPELVERGRGKKADGAKINNKKRGSKTESKSLGGGEEETVSKRWVKMETRPRVGKRKKAARGTWSGKKWKTDGRPSNGVEKISPSTCASEGRNWSGDL